MSSLSFSFLDLFEPHVCAAVTLPIYIYTYVHMNAFRFSTQLIFVYFFSICLRLLLLETLQISPKYGAERKANVD